MEAFITALISGLSQCDIVDRLLFDCLQAAFARLDAREGMAATIGGGVPIALAGTHSVHTAP
ncbi:hypothetical protein [Noviherbaspirillum suwonense]|uniref:hypothetical protein n=1 Tax=Noviherbaspirillum suwonense TaxID=1224511 RepID=UPI0024B86C67|nr:hypothetical protein [Noviherbaspirillum suwonense]